MSRDSAEIGCGNTFDRLRDRADRLAHRLAGDAVTPSQKEECLAAFLAERARAVQETKAAIFEHRTN